MRSPIVCRKTILIPVVPELTGENPSYDHSIQRKNMELYLARNDFLPGRHLNADGYVSIPVSAWNTKLGRGYWPLNEKGGTVKRRKVFPCNHTGFGDYCHLCKPNSPRDSKRALAGEYGDKVQRKEKSKPGKEVIKNGGKEKVKDKPKDKPKDKVKVKDTGKKKQQVKRKGVRGKAGS